MFHRTVFDRRENRVKHSRAVKFYHNHIFVELDIVSDHFAASVGGVLEIKQRDIHGDPLGA